MRHVVHFISGLPRSGSTLLAAILRQNSRVHARVESPLAELMTSLIRAMSQSEGALFISDEQRAAILQGLAEAYYAKFPQPVIFDTHRQWCTLIATVMELFPQSKIICCIRNPAWILDSFDRLLQVNNLRTSALFNHDIATSSGRADFLMQRKHLVGASLDAFRQVWFGSGADRMIAVRYKSLTERPSETMARLYDLLGEEHFAHTFDNLDYDESEFDRRLGTPGLHRVKSCVQAVERESVLPPDVFARYDQEFWELPDQNPRGVIVL